MAAIVGPVNREPVDLFDCEIRIALCNFSQKNIDTLSAVSGELRGAFPSNVAKRYLDRSIIKWRSAHQRVPSEVLFDLIEVFAAECLKSPQGIFLELLFPTGDTTDSGYLTASMRMNMQNELHDFMFALLNFLSSPQLPSNKVPIPNLAHQSDSRLAITKSGISICRTPIEFGSKLSEAISNLAIEKRRPIEEIACTYLEISQNDVPKRFIQLGHPLARVPAPEVHQYMRELFQQRALVIEERQAREKLDRDKLDMMEAPSKVLEAMKAAQQYENSIAQASNINNTIPDWSRKIDVAQLGRASQSDMQAKQRAADQARESAMLAASLKTQSNSVAVETFEARMLASAKSSSQNHGPQSVVSTPPNVGQGVNQSSSSQQGGQPSNNSRSSTAAPQHHQALRGSTPAPSMPLIGPVVSLPVVQPHAPMQRGVITPPTGIPLPGGGHLQFSRVAPVPAGGGRGTNQSSSSSSSWVPNNNNGGKSNARKG